MSARKIASPQIIAPNKDAIRHEQTAESQQAENLAHDRLVYHRAEAGHEGQQAGMQRIEAKPHLQQEGEAETAPPRSLTG